MIFVLFVAVDMEAVMPPLGFSTQENCRNAAMAAVTLMRSNMQAVCIDSRSGEVVVRLART